MSVTTFAHLTPRPAAVSSRRPASALTGGQPATPPQARPHSTTVTAARPAPPASTPVDVTIELRLPLDSANRAVLETLAALRATVQAMTGTAVRVALAAAAPAAPAPISVIPAAAPTDADPNTVRILPDERGVWRGAEEIQLSRLEFDLLLFLAEHPRRVFSRRQLLESVWGYTQASGRTVDVHVRRLRMKLGDGDQLLTTIRGIGYRLDNAARITVIRGGPADRASQAS